MAKNPQVKKQTSKELCAGSILEILPDGKAKINNAYQFGKPDFSSFTFESEQSAREFFTTNHEYFETVGHR